MTTPAAVRQRMVHRCTIERDTQMMKNAHGHSGPPSLPAHLTDQPCFFYARRARESVGIERTAAIESYALLLPRGVDVKESDRVNGVADRLGGVILSGAMNVRAVRLHHGHVELELDAVR